VWFLYEPTFIRSVLQVLLTADVPSSLIPFTLMMEASHTRIHHSSLLSVPYKKANVLNAYKTTTDLVAIWYWRLYIKHYWANVIMSHDGAI
jgi:hypothetical protein